MPALPPVPSTIKVIYNLGIGTDTNAIVREYFGYSGSAPTAAQCITLAGVIRTAWGNNLKALVSANTNLISTTVIDLSSASGASGVDTTGITGTRTGTSLPAGVAVLVNKKVSRRYRGGKPRSYWPFFTNTDISSPSAWLAASVNSAQTAVNAFYTAVIGAVVGSGAITQESNVSFYNGFTVVTNPVTGRTRNVPKLRAGGPLVDTVTSNVVNSLPASQRRRNLHSK